MKDKPSCYKVFKKFREIGYFSGWSDHPNWSRPLVCRVFFTNVKRFYENTCRRCPPLKRKWFGISEKDKEGQPLKDTNQRDRLLFMMRSTDTIIPNSDTWALKKRATQ